MFDNPPTHLFGDPVNSVLFMDAEKSGLSASYRASIADGLLVAPTDLAAKKSWMNDYFMKQLRPRAFIDLVVQRLADNPEYVLSDEELQRK